MSIFDIFKKSETKKLPADQFPETAGMYSVYGNSTNINVTTDTAIAIPSVWAAVRAIAETLSTLEMRVMEKKKGYFEEAIDHPINYLLNVRPHPELSPSVFKLIVAAHVALRGNSYVYIERDKYFKPVSMMPLYPDYTTVKRDEKGELYYTTVVNGVRYRLPKENVSHMTGFTLRGALGLDPISCLNESLGLALSAQSFGAEFFGNGGALSGVLETDKPLSTEAQRSLGAAFNEAYTGSGNQHKTAILINGLKYKAVGSTPDKAQFIETRKYQVVEICRMFRVPPHLVYDLEKATFSNIEHQDLAFVKYSLSSFAKRIEEALAYDLLRMDEQAKYKIKFNFHDLLQGDTKTRSQYYKDGILTGWMTKNEARRMEGLPPMEGGDELYTPLNMMADDELKRQNEEDGKILKETEEE